MTAQEIYRSLPAVFPEKAHTILGEVRNGTGFVRSPRTADALFVSTWPSRGIWLAGVEIKVYLGDWKRELANPEKAEAIEKYCHYWYVAAPEGLVPLNELPDTWGLIEVGKKTRITVKPKHKEPKAADLLFLCSILRNVSESYVPKSQVNEMANAAAARLEDHRSEELKRLREAVAKFEKASGVKLEREWNYGEIGEAVKVVIDSGILHRSDRLTALRTQAAGVVEACDRIAAALKPGESAA